jgi:HEAT repeat protein
MSRDRREVPDPAAGRRPGRGLALLTLLVALYAAVVSTLAWTKAPAAGGAGDASAAGKGGLEAALDENARRLRTEMKEDFQRAVDDTKGQVNRVARLFEEKAQAIQAAVDSGKRSADGLARAASTRAELLEDQVKDLSQRSTSLNGTVDALSIAVRALERRPAAAPAPAPAPVPAPAPAPAAAPEPPPAPRGPSPAEIAANKEKVKRLLRDLADPEKALPAATELGSLGDLEAVEPLVKMLEKSKDPYARTAAAEALGKLAACDAVPALIAALLDRDPAVFLQAGVSLRRITGEDSKLSGDSSKKERNDARERYVRLWRDQEASIRQRLGQSAKEPAKDPAAGADGQK